MTDHAEEQANELEALRSIFPDEFEELDAGPPAAFRIHIKPEDIPEDVAHLDPSLYLTITYTETYPDTLPELSLTDVTGLNEEDTHTLLESINECAREYVGMAMVFTLAASAKETFERLLQEQSERKATKEAARIAAEEEAERQRHAGTRVTPANFDIWKAKFLEEIAGILKQPKGEELLTPAQRAAAAVGGLLESLKGGKGTKLTGRQLFEKDQSLAESDMAFIEEGDVTVDVELFEGMEDLDLDDEDEEENSVLANFRDADD
ncbi:hypothetical protein SpCBS45565_g05630 [Spizellomyces sp. 'palustris']|nr:hypothetical protein SpCBS45565_g05630 [Spizellomyces sp. 'palustris']